MPSKKVNSAETDSSATIPAIDPGLRYEEALKDLEKLKTVKMSLCLLMRLKDNFKN